MGHWDHAVLGQKWLNTQCGEGRCARKSPIMKWANALKESSKKNSLKSNAASHNNASWYTDTDGFLEHSPSGGSLYHKGPALQKIIPFWGVSPHIVYISAPDIPCRFCFSALITDSTSPAKLLLNKSKTISTWQANLAE